MTRSIYTTGGTVQAGGGIYLSRKADDELLQLCREGQFAYVLTSRQMGKSSLMVQTAERLEDEGVTSVIIDLTKIGTNVTPEQWYLGLLTEIDESLMLDTDIFDWWEEHSHLGVTQRLTRFFEKVLLSEAEGRIVLFVDEIDTTLNLEFTDDFFIAIRYFYTARAHKNQLNHLSFVLVGVATPDELIKDSKRTPFNIGQRVNLTDFSLDEALPLMEGLALKKTNSYQILKWIFKWTNGHPYLTQRFCKLLSTQTKVVCTEENIDNIANIYFLGKNCYQDSNLQFIRDMLIARSPNKQNVLRTYKDILNHQKIIFDDEKSVIKAHLKISGIVQKRGNFLKERNLIYKTVFNEVWINQNLTYSVEITPKTLEHLRYAAIYSSISTFLVFFLRLIGFLEPVELKGFDLLNWSLPLNESFDEHIVLIGIEEETIEKYGYPLPFKPLDKVIEVVQKGNPATVGIHLINEIKVSETDINKNIASRIEQYSNTYYDGGKAKQYNTIVLASNFEKAYSEDSLQFINDFSKQYTEDNFGVNAVVSDEFNSYKVLPEDYKDSVVRRAFLGGFDDNQDFYFSFSIQIARLFFWSKAQPSSPGVIELENGISDPATMRFSGVELQRVLSYSGGYAKRSFSFTTFFSQRRHRSPFRVLSFEDVLSSNIDVETLENKIVLIGMTAHKHALKFRTSRSESLTGLELQAHKISQIISAVIDQRPLIWAQSKGVEYFWIWIISSGSSFFILYSLDRKSFFFRLSTIIVIILLSSQLFLLFIGLWFPWVPSLLAFLTAIMMLEVFQKRKQLND
ncbi:MAG: AAA-like domain-containing protein [Cyanobacteria bacterium P01_H01_bin.105]